MVYLTLGTLSSLALHLIPKWRIDLLLTRTDNVKGTIKTMFPVELLQSSLKLNSAFVIMIYIDKCSATTGPTGGTHLI